MGYRIAVVGATGAVGQEMLKVLGARAFPVQSLRLLASSRSVGRTITFLGEELPVEELSEESLREVDLALFSAGSATSKRFAPSAAEAGVLVVDNSSAFRMDPAVPLVVPELNPEAARGMRKGIIANPNCTTIIALMALGPLHRAKGIERFTAASYQAASGAGARALAELEDQLRAWAADEPISVSVFPHQLALNCLPQVDAFLTDGYTREELKLSRETRKILSDDGIRCSATCVRVPVLRSHAVAIHLETREPLTPEEARGILRDSPGVVVEDDPGAGRYPMQLDVAGRDHVAVGRIRSDMSHPGGLVLWVAGDQLLKGAALNAVQCAELALGVGAFAGI
ncbi:aspartate-semialdehyde dehydrogenase [Planctomycetota bacterium]